MPEIVYFSGCTSDTSAWVTQEGAHPNSPFLLLVWDRWTRSWLAGCMWGVVFQQNQSKQEPGRSILPEWLRVEGIAWQAVYFPCSLCITFPFLHSLPQVPQVIRVEHKFFLTCPKKSVPEGPTSQIQQTISMAQNGEEPRFPCTASLDNLKVCTGPTGRQQMKCTGTQKRALAPLNMIHAPPQSCVVALKANHHNAGASVFLEAAENFCSSESVMRPGHLQIGWTFKNWGIKEVIL